MRRAVFSRSVLVVVLAFGASAAGSSTGGGRSTASLDLSTSAAGGFPEGAVVATPDTLYMGFGLEGISTPAAAERGDAQVDGLPAALTLDLPRAGLARPALGTPRPRSPSVSAPAS